MIFCYWLNPGFGLVGPTHINIVQSLLLLRPFPVWFFSFYRIKCILLLIEVLEGIIYLCAVKRLGSLPAPTMHVVRPKRELLASKVCDIICWSSVGDEFFKVCFIFNIYAYNNKWSAFSIFILLCEVVYFKNSLWYCTNRYLIGSHGHGHLTVDSVFLQLWGMPFQSHLVLLSMTWQFPTPQGTAWMLLIAYWSVWVLKSTRYILLKELILWAVPYEQSHHMVLET